MAETKQDDTPTIEDMLRPQPESTEPDYLAWRDEKVRAAIEHSRKHPESLKPLRDVAKKYGLEY
ncbi:hypothetical protein [Pseudaestuariivita rosea]|uniref:hypothetical protein n=1 Tax=Pseudaestuariivita rosea TaxID=2763263 RepID=UPI001ABA8A0D|nr:hypothetical protein [Pseudaestuariivita rosea]